MIYFIQAEQSGHIKIGKANEPAKRLAQLQTGSHERLSILGTMPGDLEEEQRLHQRFAPFRLNGEWFRGDEQVLTGIKQILSPELPVFCWENTPVKTVYLAGKISGDYWRDEIAPGWSDYGKGATNSGCAETLGWDSADCECRSREFGYQPIQMSGPFWEDLWSGHGGPGEAFHGITIKERDRLGRFQVEAPGENECRNVVSSVTRAIQGSDLVFAWINSLDCFGTIFEIGYAVAAGVPVAVWTPPDFDATEIWLSLASGAYVNRAGSAGIAWNWMFDRERYCS